jgi:putative pyoverdin transport system ATP-binding/permease protein
VELFGLFTDRSPNKVFLSILLGALAGIAYASLIPIVLASLGSTSDGERSIARVHTILSFKVSNYPFACVFAFVCLFILATRALSQVLLTRAALDATTALRIRAYESIMRAPIAQLESLGPSKLMAAVTNDVVRIIGGASVVPNILVASVTVAGMLIYLFCLSSKVFWFVMGAIGFGVATYQIPMYIGNRYFERGRARIDSMYESIRGLIYGNKQLKLHRNQRERYFAEILLESEYAVRDNGKRGNTIISIAACYGDLLSFFVIGVVAYVFVGYYPIDAGKLTGVVMALLYISGPIGLILSSIPQIAAATVSLRSMNRVLAQLSAEDIDEHVGQLDVWQTLHFSGLCYSHTTSSSRFVLGPVDFAIERGEITFIVGGNGSGKSTLGKLIALHYWPAAGEIHFGEVKVDRSSIETCRQQIAAIFTDYYLFDRLLLRIDERNESLVNRYLTELELQNEVFMTAGRFSSLALSDGQRKRLALLVMLLEERGLYIFDEWAADQDPLFKEVFYHRMLPELKDRNKAVVVISHDDRYFHVADQVLIMEDGKLLRTERAGVRKSCR